MWSRRLAGFAAGLTFALIGVGGLVTNTTSGLACPDWPTCFGSPLPKMVGGVAVEMGHRYLASALGFCCLVLAFGALWSAGRRALAWVCCGVLVPAALLGMALAVHGRNGTGTLSPLPAAVGLAALGTLFWIAATAPRTARLPLLALSIVVLQGWLGGATVVFLLPPTVLILHTMTAMLVLVCLLALGLRRESQPSTAPLPARGLWRLTAAATFGQIVLGGIVRHTGIGLICTDLPFCHGALWPTGVHPAFHVNLLHTRVMPLLVACLVFLSCRAVLRSGADAKAKALAWAALGAVGLQIFLGILTILTFKNLVPLTAHLVVGELLLAVSVAQLARSSPAPAPAQLPAAPAALPGQGALA